MVTLRHEPGSIAPLRGTYVLVDHFNGSSGVAQWYEQGAKFPPAVIDGGTGPFWYIRVDESTADALAA